MKKLKLPIYIIFFALLYFVIFITIQYWLRTSRRPKDTLNEFIGTFEQGKIYFDAIQQKVDIGHGNYFRNDGAVKNLDEHSRKLRFELAGLNRLPLEEIDKIVPEPRDFVNGLSFVINLDGKKFVIFFYTSTDKSPKEITGEKVHEETHALIHFGKIDLIKKFLTSKNISIKYDENELFKLAGVDPDNRHHINTFSSVIQNKEAAYAEFLAQKIQQYHQNK